MTDSHDEVCREACESARALTECPLGPIVAREFGATYDRIEMRSTLSEREDGA